jgi:hypothetical protein
MEASIASRGDALMSEDGVALAKSYAAEQEREALASAAWRNAPEAAKELAQEAWDDPWQTAKSVGITFASAVAAGKLFSMIIPARGPAALMTGAVMTIPLVTREYHRWNQASDLATLPGADMDEIGKDLAKGTFSTIGHTGLGFLGGTVGSRLGTSIATSDTMLGQWSQNTQRKVLALENEALLGLSKIPQVLSEQRAASVGIGSNVQRAAVAAEQGGVWFAPRNSLMETRMTQLGAGATEGAMPQHDAQEPPRREESRPGFLCDNRSQPHRGARWY